jgi:hypothetical protein
VLLLAEQQNEISVPSKKNTSLFVSESIGPKKKLYVVFLSITLIFYLMSHTDISRTTSQNVRIVKILIRCRVLLWLVRCLCEHEMCARHISYRNSVFINAVYRGEKHSFSFQCQQHVIVLALPGEEMTDI